MYYYTVLVIEYLKANYYWCSDSGPTLGYYMACESVVFQ